MRCGVCNRDERNDRGEQQRPTAGQSRRFGSPWPAAAVSAAVSIRQPMQHDASHSLPSGWLPAGGAVPPASLWQVIVPGVGTAARATSKLTIRLDSTIA